MKKLWFWLLGLIPGVQSLRQQVYALEAQLRDRSRYFEPALSDLDWAQRVRGFAVTIQRKQAFSNGVPVGQMNGLSDMLASLLTQVSLALRAGNMATVHAWLNGPKRPDSHAQRHNNVLTDLQEMADHKELSEALVREIQRGLTEEFFRRSKNWRNPLDVQAMTITPMTPKKAIVEVTRTLEAKKDGN